MLDSAVPLVNRLDRETSPYLLQHKDNPVAWQPWGRDAFEAARRTGRPVLLSVGYAACHWCHVMAHECFENEAIARRMNELFVNIKLDREERPDVDGIYQQALSLLGEQGGWPLTIFLTPDGAPFWGGTYFPPEPRFGRPGFIQVLQAISEVYIHDPERVAKNVTALGQALQSLSRSSSAGTFSLAASDRLAGTLARQVDPEEGGIGTAPKFPQSGAMKLLWRAWKRTGARACRDAVELTLSKMCQGGIYDHLGGGFARYAVDRRWLVPHFEKMLYDNAQMIDLLSWVWQDTRNPLYEQRARESVDWVLREMLAAADAQGTAPCGAFASTLDADSEGEEGKFYVWSEAEVDAVLGADAPLFKRVYDVRAEGNWEGKTILNRTHHPAPEDPETEAVLAACRGKLLAARGARVRPGWDDKVLADWNGLMIAALARAAPVFEAPAWRAAAVRAFAFVRDTMCRDGRLMRSWRHGRLQHAGLLDDYANMAEAALALAEGGDDDAYVAQAEAWVEVLDRHFWDREGGGYFLAPDDGERLIVRTKTALDSAVPAGNGTMVAVLARLYYLTGKPAYRERAEAVIATFSGDLERAFAAMATLVDGHELLHRALQIVLLGAPGAPDSQALLNAVQRINLPNRILQIVAPGETLPPDHPAHGKGQEHGRATAYVCRGTRCSLPIGDPDELGAALAGA